MAQPLFEETLEAIEAWKARPEVIGIVHVGSKSRGHGDATSDDDLEIVLTEEAYSALTPAGCIEVLVNGQGREIWDAQMLPLSDLMRKAGSTLDLDRWPYEQAPIVFDRDGRVSTVVANIGSMSSEFRSARILHGALDAGINAHRSQKARSRSQEVAARALIGRAALALTRIVFALERRWAPLDHWLEKELRTLEDPSAAADGIRDGLTNADPAAIFHALSRLEARLAADGFPTERAGRQALFAELIHPARAAERAVHGLI